MSEREKERLMLVDLVNRVMNEDPEILLERFGTPEVMEIFKTYTDSYIRIVMGW